MNGVCYFMRQQGRTAAELVRLTGLPERVITSLLEEQEYQMPSCYYMAVASALGVSVDELLMDYSEDDEETECMPWEERFERKPDMICKIYLAKITGRHAEYRYQREFQRLQFEYLDSYIYCSADLEDGVYEVRARWYDYSNPKAEACWERSWFVVYDGIPYDLDESDVLFAAFNIEAQHGRLAA